MSTHTKGSNINGSASSHGPYPSAPSPHESTLYEQVESQATSAFEQLVAKPSFGRLLAMSGENVAALARISSDAADLVLRNLRIAGRSDITRLARQLHRTEDKLERVLQEVEGLSDQLARPSDRELARPSDRGPRPEAVKRS